MSAKTPTSCSGTVIHSRLTPSPTKSGSMVNSSSIALRQATACRTTRASRRRASDEKADQCVFCRSDVGLPAGANSREDCRHKGRQTDRKSGVEGKSEELGGRRIIKK